MQAVFIGRSVDPAPEVATDSANTDEIVVIPGLDSVRELTRRVPLRRAVGVLCPLSNTLDDDGINDPLLAKDGMLTVSVAGAAALPADAVDEKPVTIGFRELPIGEAEDEPTFDGLWELAPDKVADVPAIDGFLMDPVDTTPEKSALLSPDRFDVVLSEDETEVLALDGESPGLLLSDGEAERAMGLFELLVVGECKLLE